VFISGYKGMGAFLLDLVVSALVLNMIMILGEDRLIGKF
jgi:hypothetical protein